MRGLLADTLPFSSGALSTHPAASGKEEKGGCGEKTSALMRAGTGRSQSHRAQDRHSTRRSPVLLASLQCGGKSCVNYRVLPGGAGWQQPSQVEFPSRGPRATEQRGGAEGAPFPRTVSKRAGTTTSTTTTTKDRNQKLPSGRCPGPAGRRGRVSPPP